MTHEVKFQPDKFKELVLYVADRSVEDPAFGATKLNKILFFSDFIAYGRHGRPITGARYQRLERGPAPRELLPAQKQLAEANEAVVVKQRRFNFEQKRLLPLREPDLSLFSGEEIALVDRVIDLLRHYDATSVSALSHEIAVGWRLAGDGEDIPYESVFISNDPPTPTDIRKGQELAKKHGWLAVV
jgi:hypothetical protein